MHTSYSLVGFERCFWRLAIPQQVLGQLANLQLGVQQHPLLFQGEPRCILQLQSPLKLLQVILERGYNALSLRLARWPMHLDKHQNHLKLEQYDKTASG